MSSGLSIFKKISQKLDEGWKLTNVNCPICNTSIIGQLNPKQFYCVKCEMPVKIEEDEDEDVEVIGSRNGSNEGKQEVNDFDNMLYAKENEAKRKKADELSKKMGEKLLQGWAMLEDSCFDCMFPLMRSRKGETVCVGCGPVGQKKEESPQKVISQEPEVQKVEQFEKKVEKIPERSPVKQQPEKVLPKVDNFIRAPVQEEKVVEKRAESPKEEKVKSKAKVNTQEVFEFLQFDESVNFYTRLTQYLSADLDRLGQQGLVYNLEKTKELLNIQKSVDEEKMKILKKYKKAHQ